MQGNSIKDEEKFSLFLKKIYFHCPNQMCLVKMNWKKNILVMKNNNNKNIPFKLNFLQEYNQAPYSEKENKLLNRDFGYKHIDELVLAFNNTKTDEELDKLFNKIDNKLNLLKKLINTVSDITEKKRINNVIKGVRFVLDYIVSNENVSYSNSKQDFCDSDFSNTKERKGLQVLTPDQMVSRLPITLAQLKVGNSSEKLKNEITQLLYSLYRSKKLTKQLYKSLIDTI